MLRRGPPAHRLRLPAAAVALAVGCQPAPRADDEPAPSDRRVLPAPDRDGGGALFRAIARRRSIRALGGDAPADADLGQLLWAAQGITDDDAGLRAAPSAGALYPLTLHVADARGVWRYRPRDHALGRAVIDDRRAALARAGLDQEPLRDAPVIVVITGREAVTAGKYGAARAGRYVALEAGHAAHGLLLAATALDLAAVPIGAFDDAAVRAALDLDPGDAPLYLIPVGRGDR